MGTDVELQAQPVVSLTQKASEHVRLLLAQEPENAGKFLRIYVEGGGCSGMQYGMLFDQKRENDSTSEFFGVAVVVDPVSADHLRGTVVDYSDDLTGGGFKITNPKARSSCGCGKSFEA